MNERYLASLERVVKGKDPCDAANNCDRCIAKGGEVYCNAFFLYKKTGEEGVSERAILAAKNTIIVYWLDPAIDVKATFWEIFAGHEP